MKTDALTNHLSKYFIILVILKMDFVFFYNLYYSEVSKDGKNRILGDLFVLQIMFKE